MSILNLKEALDSDQLPDSSADCDYCRYREVVGKKLREHVSADEDAAAAGTLGI